REQPELVRARLADAREALEQSARPPLVRLAPRRGGQRVQARRLRQPRALAQLLGAPLGLHAAALDDLLDHARSRAQDHLGRRADLFAQRAEGLLAAPV